MDNMYSLMPAKFPGEPEDLKNSSIWDSHKRSAHIKAWVYVKSRIVNVMSEQKYFPAPDEIRSFWREALG
jgi:hypothetical protein